MTTKRNKRDDPRAAATRAAVIEAAESLFAQSGLDGVSLRQIASAAGAANTNVVAYHFGSKDALIEAIFRQRLPEIEARRAALLQTAEAAGGGHDLSALLDALWRPFLEQTNLEGRHSYAAFLMSVSRSNRFDLRISLNPDFPATQAIVARIAAASGTDNDAGAHRLTILLAMIAAALDQIDQQTLDRRQGEARFADVLGMAEMALRTPTTPSENDP